MGNDDQARDDSPWLRLHQPTCKLKGLSALMVHVDEDVVLSALAFHGLGFLLAEIAAEVESVLTDMDVPDRHHDATDDAVSSAAPFSSPTDDNRQDQP